MSSVTPLESTAKRHSGIHAIKQGMQHFWFDRPPYGNQSLLQLLHTVDFALLVQFPVHPGPKILNGGQVRGVCWPLWERASRHNALNQLHIVFSHMHLGIVLLQLPVASPMGTLLEQSVTLWLEQLSDHITVLISADSSVATPIFGVGVVAGLLVSASHKHQLGGTPVADTHVHMYCNGMTDPGDCASSLWRAPPDHWSAFGLCLKVLRISDQDSTP